MLQEKIPRKRQGASMKLPVVLGVRDWKRDNRYQQ